MLKFKSIFISDLHLGSRGCSDNELLFFLKNSRSDNLFLIGDIIDGWAINTKLNWNHNKTLILKDFIEKSYDTNMKWVIGNHDDFMRPFIPMEIFDIDIIDNFVYETNGKKYFITHGDQYDTFIVKYNFISKIGNKIYDKLIMLNKKFNSIRNYFNMSYWSLSQYIKNNVKKAVSIINTYEQQLINVTKENNCDGIISGHIHYPEIKFVDDILYMNDGDFVETKSALVEEYDGTFKILIIDNNKIYEIITYKKGILIKHDIPLLLLEK